MKINKLPIVLLPLLLTGCVNNPENNNNQVPTHEHIDTEFDGYCDECNELMEVEESKREDYLPKVDEVKLMFKHSKEETVGDDGEDYFYNYCPSIFIENNKEYVYYCTNKDWGNVTDYIGFRSATNEHGPIMYTDEELVISPTKNTWDQAHACDPTVIKGEFKYNNEDYNYLMAYLGCVPLDCTLNETGLAVSKTPNGPWIKCNDLKIDGETPINPFVPYSDFDVTEKNWGTGQACLMSVDKKGRVLLFTSIGARTGSFTDVREYDLSNINDYKLIREAKLFEDGSESPINNKRKDIKNAEYCYDEKNKKFIMSKPRSGFGLDGEYPDFIADTIDVYYLDAKNYDNPFDIFFDESRTEKWEYINSITPELSGYPRNHNNGLVTDEYQHLYKDGYIGVAFTSSQYGSMSAMTYLKTYRLFLTTFKLPY